MVKNGLVTCLILMLLIGISCTNELNAQTYNWHSLEATGSATERHENAFVRSGDLFILIGGRGLKPVDIYNTQTREWTQGAQPPFEIHHIQAVELDGLVYIVGALSGSWPYETPLSHILIYDPNLDLWAIGPEIPKDRRRGATGSVVYDEKIYIVCGIINGHTSGWVSWLDEFNPATNEWRKLPDAPRTRDHLHAAVVDDKLVVTGGRRSGYDSQGFEATVSETDVFDFTTREWRTLPSPEGDIPTERAGTSAAVHQGNVVIIGGESGSQQAAHSEAEMLDFSTGTWEALPSLLRGRHGTQAIYFDDMIIIGAGSGDRGGGPELNSFEIFATENNPDITSNPLNRAEVSVSTDEILFSPDEHGQSKQVTLQSQNGNLASLITYIQLDDTSGFSIQKPIHTPFVLAPGRQVPIDVTWNGSTSDSPPANLLIKTFGGDEPLRIEVSVRD